MIQTYSSANTLNNITLGKLKVLLAEDNEVNQLLAKSILRHWGFETKVAVTGFEVLSLLHNEDFDLILMDIQMPEKSGIEAASEIRKLLDEKKKNIPIIALTANALIGEEKKYMAVGMDDFLTKPFKEFELYEVIQRVLRKEGSFGRKIINPVKTIEMPEEKEISNKLYDLSSLEKMVAGDRDFLAELARVYLDTVPANSAELVEATKKGDWLNASKLAHKLKSTINNMNITVIKTDIQSIETDGKNKANTEAIKLLALKVDKIINEVAAQLKIEFSL